jgi:Mn2+/Fe2+ NRAMP family transporter
MAGAAIGVSHLVQSTRAGAEFGWAVLPAIVVACAAKYPFLEFGPRYAAATGESLIDGYRRLGRWALGAFAVITIGTMFTTLASVTAVTAGLAANLFGIWPDVHPWSAAILSACVLLLLIGRYAALDLVMKVVIAVLALSTVAAVVLAFGHGGEPIDAPSPYTIAALPFLLALMGWMPVPLDVAVWHSLWTIERDAQTRPSVTVAAASGDFNLGYAVAFLMAIAFLALGVLLMHASGEQFAAGAVAFTGQLVGLYTTTLGSAAAPVITLAVLTTMFSTTLAVTDAYPRVVEGAWRVVRRQPGSSAGSRVPYLVALPVIPAGAMVVLAVFGGRMTLLIDVATTLAFLSAPLLAMMNYRLVTGRHMPEAARPARALRILSWAGLTVLTGLAVAYLVVLVL